MQLNSWKRVHLNDNRVKQVKQFKKRKESLIKIKLNWVISVLKYKPEFQQK